jgi:spore coat polysaccharide biosynthesis predicted glycosyltransferase SpsG
MRISFITDSGFRYGMGHVVRCNTLKKHLVQHRQCVITDDNPDVVIIDIQENKDPTPFLNTRAKTVLIDNRTPGRFLADVNVYPCLKEHVQNLSWRGYQGKVYIGEEYFPVREGILKCQLQKVCDKVIINFGATDPYGVTERVLEVLGDVSVGLEYLSKARLAIVGFGITMYELSYLSIPFIVIAHTKDPISYTSFEALRSLGCCAYLGHHTEVDYSVLNALILPSREGHKQVDGYGTQRFAGIILE